MMRSDAVIAVLGNLVNDVMLKLMQDVVVLRICIVNDS